MLAIFAPAAAAQRTAPAAPYRDTTLRLLDTPFTVRMHTTGRAAARARTRGGVVRPALGPRPDARWVFVNVHDDESTSVTAALQALARVPTRLVELRHTGARTLVFSRAGERFEVDPNRIFTDAGAAATLARWSGRADSSAAAAVRRFAEGLLGHADVVRAEAVIALHNNTDAHYTVRSYLPGAEYAGDAAAVHLHPGADPDDFFFVTDRPLYDALAAEGFHVVLQNNTHATDDGSLSVWAGQRGKRYVNVEAQHGHVDMQRRMIAALVRVLRRLESRR